MWKYIQELFSLFFMTAGAVFHAHTVHTANSRYYDTNQAAKKAVSHYDGINVAPRFGRHFAVFHNERRPHFI
jgi:hypothetical protein